MRYGPQAPIVAGILIQTTGLAIVIAGIRRVLIGGATAALSSLDAAIGVATVVTSASDPLTWLDAGATRPGAAIRDRQAVMASSAPRPPRT